MHHRYSPSQLERIELCPGSAKLSQDCPRLPSPAAEEGTMLHRAVTPKGRVFFAALTAEQQDQVQKCIDFIGTFERAASFTYESKMVLHDNFDILTNGSADLVVHEEHAARVHVIDWKFGREPVTDVDQNIQIQVYGAMALQRIRSAGEACLTIFQPRLDRVEHSIVLEMDVPGIVERVRNIIAAAESDNPILRPSDKACVFCPAKFKCPALRAEAVAQIDSHSSDVMDPNVMATLIPVAKKASAWADSVLFHAKKMAIDLRKFGEAIPGWELRRRAGSRKVSDPQKAFDRLAGYFSVEEFMTFATLDYGKLEDAFVHKERLREGITLKEARARLECLLDGAIERAGEVEYLAAQKEKEVPV